MLPTQMTASGARLAQVTVLISLYTAIEACESLVGEATGPQLSKYLAERFEQLAEDVREKLVDKSVAKGGAGEGKEVE